MVEGFPELKLAKTPLPTPDWEEVLETANDSDDQEGPTPVQDPRYPKRKRFFFGNETIIITTHPKDSCSVTLSGLLYQRTDFRTKNTKTSLFWLCCKGEWSLQPVTEYSFSSIRDLRGSLSTFTFC